MNITKYIRKAAILLFPISYSLLPVGCTDKWDDHYADQTNGSGTLWQNISGNPDLSNFASVLSATGYDTDLAQSQVFTVFAPTNDKFSAADAQTLINSFNTELAQKYQGNSLKRGKTATVKEFVQNHIALYNHSMAATAFEDTTITMLNGKVLPFHSDSFSGVQYQKKNIVTGNGILYTIDGRANYNFNIFEYINRGEQLDSVKNFVYHKTAPCVFYTDNKINVNQSVPGEIVNGVQTYLDSVCETHNSLLENKSMMNALLESEDSTYRIILPTNAAWNTMLPRNVEMFQYSDSTDNRDSLKYMMPRLMMISGAIFSKTNNPNMYQQGIDSVKSTKAIPYYQRKSAYGSYDVRKYIYMHPYNADGIFNSITPFTCSNGDVLTEPDWKVKRNETFLSNIIREAEDATEVDSLSIGSSSSTVSWKNKPTWKTYEVPAGYTKYFNKVSGNKFCQLMTTTAIHTPFVLLGVPNVLSNVDYEIYITTVPIAAADSTKTQGSDILPFRMTATIYYQNPDGSEMSKDVNDEESGIEIKAGDFVNVPSSKKAKYRYAEASGTEIVESCLGTFRFPTCSYGLSKPQVKILIQARGGTDAQDGVCIDKITLVPKNDE